MAKKFKWTIEVEVDETWVADGFDLTQDRAHDAILCELPFAYPEEVTVKVLKAPSKNSILVAQGFKAEKVA